MAVFFSIIKAALGYLLILAAFNAYGFLQKDLCQIQDIDPGFFSQNCPALPPPDQPASASGDLLIDIFFLCSLVVAMAFFVVYRKAKNNWHRFIYAKNQTEEAYTLLVSNIPVLDFPKPGEGKSKSEFFYRKHLEDYLEDRIRTWAETSDTWERDVDSNENDYLEVGMGRFRCCGRTRARSSPRPSSSPFRSATTSAGWRSSTTRGPRSSRAGPPSSRARG